MENNIPNQAEFISLFPNTRFRYIHDVQKNAVQGNAMLDRSWNNKGYGVFFTINGFPSTGKADESKLLSLNGNYVDFDVDVSLSQEEKGKRIQETLMSGLEAGVPTPTIVNRTQKGAHLIWMYPRPLDPTTENVAKWRDVQRRVVHCFGGDTNPVDPSRVLRLPYTLHLKDPGNPFEIRVMSYKPEARCTLDELDAVVPKYSDDEIAQSKVPAKDALLNGVTIGKGLRHMAMAQVAGLALKGARTPEQIEMARLALYGWDRCVVKSPEPFQQRKKELDDTIEGIVKREMAGKEVSNDLPFNIQSWKDFRQREFPKERWWIDNLIPKGSLVIIAAPSGERKSWTALEMARCIASGTSFLNHFETKQARVLYIEQESPQSEIQRRGKQLGFAAEEDFSLLSQDDLNLNDPSTVERLFKVVIERGIEVVFVDTFRSVGGGIPEDKAEAIRPFFSRFKSWKEQGITIVFLDHCRKPRQFENTHIPKKDQLLGSQDKTASVETLHMMRSKERSNEITFYPIKMRLGLESPPFRITISDKKDGDVTSTTLAYAGKIEEHQIKKDEAKESILAYLQEEVDKKTSKEIIEALEGVCGKSAVEEALKEMREEQSIESAKVGTKYLYWDKSTINESAEDVRPDDKFFLETPDLPNAQSG